MCKQPLKGKNGSIPIMNRKRDVTRFSRFSPQKKGRDPFFRFSPFFTDGENRKGRISNIMKLFFRSPEKWVF